MLLLVNPYLPVVPPTDLSIKVRDLFDVYLGLVDSRFEYKGPAGEQLVLIRPSSIEFSAKKLKNMEELSQKEKLLHQKRKTVTDEANATTKYLKDRSLFLKKNDLLVPLKGKTQVLVFDQEIDDSLGFYLVPSHHFIVLRKREIHKQFYTPYLVLMTQLFLEKIGTENYSKKIEDVKGEYGLFNTFNKKQIESLSIHLHSNQDDQHRLFVQHNILINELEEKIQVQKKFYEKLLEA